MARLDELHESWGNRLPRPATAKALDATERKLGRKLPSALRTLWAWHDGSDGVEFDGVHCLLSVKEALRWKQMLDEMAEQGHFEDWQPGTWWNSGWLPFLEFNGNLYVVDLRRCGKDPVGQVREVRSHDRDRSAHYRSLAAWAHTVVEISSRAACAEEDRVSFLLSSVARKLRRDLNPGYPRLAEAEPLRIPR